ncbi:MAG: cbb3-type cytochrome c oxidase subunit 3 [Parvibaculum sp.]|uniref:cbb3-type cytochrome c oxidase subunit 3 n=1 Tax=Parvibaculum sp. TaxID=2024848 RepID=UPI002600A3D9|nr:cbb3-type cytochrome c oxidase subunit 3 [Parvibaculum sp.]MCE9650097.1 cbb3-type cytochrome c oxidase subunit 3 [Parvibaculum sp.]
MMQMHASASAGIVGLLIFISVFAVAVTYALWPANKQTFDRLARLPLDDDKEENRL